MNEDRVLFDSEPLEWPLYGLPQTTREEQLSHALRTLTLHHTARCQPYARIVRSMFPKWEHSGTGLAALPFIPIGLFKERRLQSFPDEELFKTLTSSGTSGAPPSRVYLDRETARRQTKALSITMQGVLGKARRPMLIVDSEAVVRDRSSFSARGAGIVGMMQFGRSHIYLLDDDMSVNQDALASFVEMKKADLQPIVFGFTFMIWLHLFEQLKDAGLDLSGATLVHSGGWKKLIDQSVTTEVFARSLKDAFGIDEVVNFYGMAEQVGSVFVEGTDGLLHTAPFADVIIRDPATWQELPTGSEGVIQVLSAVPTGYPGHSILTEDLGVVETLDDSRTPHGGKAFRVIGRVPKSELRGCSDTYAMDLS